MTTFLKAVTARYVVATTFPLLVATDFPADVFVLLRDKVRKKLAEHEIKCDLMEDNRVWGKTPPERILFPNAAGNDAPHITLGDLSRDETSVNERLETAFLPCEVKIREIQFFPTKNDIVYVVVDFADLTSLKRQSDKLSSVFGDGFVPRAKNPSYTYHVSLVAVRSHDLEKAKAALKGLPMHATVVTQSLQIWDNFHLIHQTG